MKLSKKKLKSLFFFLFFVIILIIPISFIITKSVNKGKDITDRNNDNLNLESSRKANISNVEKLLITNKIEEQGLLQKLKNDGKLNSDENDWRNYFNAAAKLSELSIRWTIVSNLISEISNGENLPPSPLPGSNRWLTTEDIEKTYQSIRNESPNEVLLFDVSLAHTIKLIEDYVNSQTGSGGDELKKIVREWKKAKLVFLPVSNSQMEKGGDHWSLLVYREGDKFYHFDSMGNSNFSSAKVLAYNFLKTLGKNESPNVQVASCSQQSNGYDCGVYTIIFTRALVERYKNNPAAIVNDDFWKIAEKDFKFSVSEERQKLD